MASLKELVEKHGFGIKVRCTNPKFPAINFLILAPCEDQPVTHYLTCDLETGEKFSVMKECRLTNDYEFVG